MKRLQLPKKTVLWLLVPLAMALALAVFFYRQDTPFTLFYSKAPSQVSKGGFVGDEIEGNYIWGGAMNLAWTELVESIVKEPVKLNTEDPRTLSVLEKFNNPVFTKRDIDAKDYYVKSGYGQETLDKINQESRKKFPSKSFRDLDYNLGPSDIISYAYLLKEVQYLHQFKTWQMRFEGEPVRGFSADSDEQRDNIRVIQYWNQDHFIISLQLQQSQEQLILAKGFAMDDPSDVVNAIAAEKGNEHLGDDDVFSAPNIELDYEKSYSEMVGKSLLNRSVAGYVIDVMLERIRFKMDHVGARVENEAVIVADVSALQPNPNQKRLILDKPYWIVMKQKNSNTPYFLLGVKNTSLMEKVTEE